MVEVERVAGRVTYRRSRVDPSDLGLLYQPLDYATYDRALADGVLSVPDYLERVEFHADRGDLPAELAQLVQGRRDGTLAPARTLQRDYQRNVIDRSLRSVGRGAYSFPEWQQSFVDAVQERYRLRNQGDTGAPVVVDPTTGLTPENVTPDQFALTRGASVEATADELYRYVADNIDDLLRPRSLLHAYMAPNGRMNLAVGRFRGGAEAGAEFGPAVIRPTGGSRLRFRGGDVQRAMSGNVPVAVATPQGVMQFQPAFEGAEGNRFMAQASSRGEQGAWTDQMSDTQYARLVNESRSQRDVLPNEPQYQVSWERAVNTQLANDAVARQFMAGRSVDDVMNWMRNTPEGRAYYGRLGPWQSRPVDQVYAVQAMVDTYLPRVAGDAATDATTANLRRAALDGEASYTDFQRLFPNAEDMPAVHGASLDVTVGGPFTNAVKRGVSRIFNILSDIPADRASRFPFFADRYQAHLNDIAPRFAEQAGDATLVPTADIDKIQQLARSRALADVKKYLYDTSAALDMARAGRLVVPFGSAIADSFLKWGVIARERGIAPPALQIWKLWTAPDRAGLVQDEDGNVKRYNPKTGDYQWYGKNPKTGELTLLPDHDPKQEYIVFQLPVGAPKTASGAVMPAYINKQTFNTFLGLPTAGPIVAYPANEFELRNPKLADQWFMKKFVLPFGPTSDRWKAFLPSNVRSTYNAFTEDPPSRRGLAQAVLQTEYTRWALGERSAPPTMEEVNNTAGDLYGLQYMSQLFGVSTQFKSPYQPYVDYYRSLREQDPENALARFYNDMGDEYRMMTASVSRNVAGLPVASVENAKTIQKYQDLVAKFPELSGLIIGSEGAGSFSSAVYQAQLEQSLQPGSDQKMREILSPQESVEDAQRKYVWVKYGKMMDAIEADMIRRGVKDLNSKRAKDLKKTRDQFIEANKYWTTPQGATDVSPWFSEFSTTDRAKMTSRLTAMAQIVSDDRIGQRDDMRGLYDYLSARIQVKAEMQRRGYATLDSKKAATLSKRWTQYVSGLKESNVSFAALYNRWLVGDDLTADIILQPAGVTGG